MKTIINIAAIAAAALVSCSTMTPAERLQEDAENAAWVSESIARQDITVEVTYIYPQSMPAKMSNDGYTVTVSDGKINGYLPFFGVSHVAVIAGVDETGIRFKDCPITIQEDKSKIAKGKVTWRFNAKSGNDIVNVTMNIWNNGAADITCICDRKSSMRYSGIVIEKPVEKE